MKKVIGILLMSLAMFACDDDEVIVEDVLTEEITCEDGETRNEEGECAPEDEEDETQNEEGECASDDSYIARLTNVRKTADGNEYRSDEYAYDDMECIPKDGEFTPKDVECTPKDVACSVNIGFHQLRGHFDNLVFAEYKGDDGSWHNLNNEPAVDSIKFQEGILSFTYNPKLHSSTVKQVPFNLCGIVKVESEDESDEDDSNEDESDEADEDDSGESEDEFVGGRRLEFIFDYDGEDGRLPIISVHYMTLTPDNNCGVTQ